MNEQASLTMPNLAFLLKWQKERLGEYRHFKVKVMLEHITQVHIHAKNEALIATSAEGCYNKL